MELKRLTQKDLASVQKAWTDLLKKEDHPFFLAEYKQLFEIIQATGCWAVKLTDCLNKIIYNCIVDQSGEVWAIVEIVITKNGPGSLVKILDIHLSPKIETEPDSGKNTQRRHEVFHTALNGIFLLTKQIQKADTVKVYGRTDALIAFLRGMHDSFSVFSSLGTIKGIEVTIEGRWLVFHAN